MKKNTKIWLAISGILLVVLGILCIIKPEATLFTAAWIIGCFTLFTGIFKMVFALRTERFLPNSGTRVLSALLQILIGVLFLCNNFFVAISLPMVFALWVLTEGVIIAILSFDYKKAGFTSWWTLFILGIAATILGVLGLYHLQATGNILAILIGIAIIALGVAYLAALRGIHRFDKEIGKVNANIKEMMQ
ncbi:MAG: DUF308 domain-containing protein [Bacteroidales bacterium]|nr:DUF308 domain-containing protein [Bacteroidales bacterium]